MNERWQKPATFPRDAIILDLEDSVAPAEKNTARRGAVALLDTGGFANRQMILRINALDTEWAADDVAALASCKGLDAVLLPKPGSRKDVEKLGALLHGAGASAELSIWLMIETPQGLFNLAEMLAARTNHPVGALVLGLNDLAKETRVDPGQGRANVVPWMLQCVLAARAHGLFGFDGVFNAFKDADGFAREAAQAKALGFDGKTLIHPSQISPANTAFSPNEAEIARARQIVEAFDLPANAGRGAISVDGNMIELLHRDEAQQLLARAARLP